MLNQAKWVIITSLHAAKMIFISREVKAKSANEISYLLSFDNSLLCMFLFDAAWSIIPKLWAIWAINSAESVTMFYLGTESDG